MLHAYVLIFSVKVILESVFDKSGDLLQPALLSCLKLDWFYEIHAFDCKSLGDNT